MKRIAIAAVLSAFVAAPAIAANPYVGVNVGQNKIKPTAGSLKASTAFTVLGGYSFNDHIAAEAAYTNLGSADTEPASTFTITGNVISLAAVGSLPLSKEFSLFAKLGLAQSKVEATGLSESKTGLIYGIGAQYNVSKAVGIRLGYETFKVGTTTDSVDSNLITVGAVFKM